MRTIDADKLKAKLQEHHDFFVNAYGDFKNLPPNDKSRVDEIIHCISEIVNAPTVKTYCYFCGQTEHGQRERSSDFKAGYKQAIIDGKTNYLRQQGNWIADINHCYSDDEDTFECSVCKEPFTLTYGTPKDNLYNFCPNCGADMTGMMPYER